VNRTAHASGAFAGWIALAVLGALAAGAFLPLAVIAWPDAGRALLETLSDPVIWRYLRFTLFQAAISTVLSVALAVPLAVALHEMRAFPGRRLVLRLFALPLALPQIVAVLAIVTLYGERGAISEFLREAGFGFPGLYGLAGILIAHVFFNLPLAARIMLGGLSTMPAEYEKLGAQLGMGLAARFRHLLWPFLRPALASAATLVFMLCVTSFTVVLTLGGGPRSTTLEVAIYQALTFDFDIARALVLALIQVAVTIAAFGFLTASGGEVSAGLTTGRLRNAGTRRPAAHTFAFLMIIALGTAFIALPFAAVIWRGIGADLSGLLGQASLRRALATSLTLGLAAACLAVAMSLMLAFSSAQKAAQRRYRGPPTWTEAVFSHGTGLILVVPPVVLAAGWFILIRLFLNAYAAAPMMVVAINAAMAVPFAIRLLKPAVFSTVERHDRLSAQLGIEGLSRWRLVTWPVLRRPILLSLAFALALSLGDLGVIAIFGSQDVQTLPYLIFQRMGSYRTDDAAGLALILCLLTMGLMLIADRGEERGRS
jgi:thiamine transport system permease protein